MAGEVAASTWDAVDLKGREYIASISTDKIDIVLAIALVLVALWFLKKCIVDRSVADVIVEMMREVASLLRVDVTASALNALTVILLFFIFLVSYLPSYFKKMIAVTSESINEPAINSVAFMFSIAVVGLISVWACRQKS